MLQALSMVERLHCRRTVWTQLRKQICANSEQKALQRSSGLLLVPQGRFCLAPLFYRAQAMISPLTKQSFLLSSRTVFILLVAVTIMEGRACTEQGWQGTLITAGMPSRRPPYVFLVGLSIGRLLVGKRQTGSTEDSLNDDCTGASLRRSHKTQQLEKMPMAQGPT